MISYVTIGTNRFDEAVAFYDALMPDMGAARAYATETSVGWGGASARRCPHASKV
jgi:hypothetical protein